MTASLAYKETLQRHRDTRTDPMARQEQMRIRKTLASTALFGHLPEIGIGELAEHITVKRALGGSPINASREASRSLYVVMGGRVKLVEFGENGREVTLAIRRPGDIYGEGGLVGSIARGPQAIALDPATILAIPHDLIVRHLAHYPATAMALLRIMAHRLREADQRVAELALCDVQARLVGRLVAMAREDNQVDELGLVIRRRPTQQEMANMVGSCRETVSRMVNKMMRDGELIGRGRSLVVTQALVQRVERFRGRKS